MKLRWLCALTFISSLSDTTGVPCGVCCCCGCSGGLASDVSYAQNRQTSSYDEDYGDDLQARSTGFIDDVMMGSLAEAFRDWLAPIMEPFLSGFFNQTADGSGGGSTTESVEPLAVPEAVTDAVTDAVTKAVTEASTEAATETTTEEVISPEETFLI